MGKRFVSTKEYKELAPVAYRQWRDKDGNCSLIHGYALSFYFEFESDHLDFRNWCVDYGGLRPLKEFLEEYFDHCYLLAQDEPHYDAIKKLGDLGLMKITEVEATGCEAIADFLYKYINTGFLRELGAPADVWCRCVQVRETEKNMAMRLGHQEDNEDLTVDLSKYRRDG
ncbi:6-pyruvoyl tetrahydrobiopterin synthase [Xanthomonas phage BUDD]|nr:6-pyruvoyl tetrahydrobiopterin synthase [Xanthomonas phage BUDD]